MGEKKTCAYSSGLPGIGKCSREVGQASQSEEEFCIFHSENIKEKATEFWQEVCKFDERNSIINKWQPLGGNTTCFIGFIFPGGDQFRGLNFSKNVDFRNATFEDEINFEEAKFKMNVNFRSAQFKNGVSFKNIIINKEHDNNNLMYNASNSFLLDTVKIDGNGIFTNAIVAGDVQIKSSIINGNLNFDKLKTNGKLDISHVNCSGHVSLSEVSIGAIIAENFKFNGTLLFHKINFIKNYNKEPKTSFSNMLFERTSFMDVDLSNFIFQRSFLREIKFDRVHFNTASKLPEWCVESMMFGRPSEAICEEVLARDRIKLLMKNAAKENKISNAKDVNDKFAIAESSYRALKHVMEQQHSRGLARRMRAGELECKYQGSSWWPPGEMIDKLILFMYRFLNGFGLKWKRAALFFCATFFLFFSNYVYQPASYLKVSETASGYVEMTKAKRLNPGEALWHGLETMAVVKNQTLNIIDYEIRWIEGIQRIVSPALFLLFLQAVRNVTRD